MQPANLDRVSIPIQCHADWDLMSGDDRVRYCKVSEKSVYNLSALTRRQTETLVAEHGGKLCARIYQRPDGSILTQNCPHGIRGLTAKITRRAGAVLSVMLGVGILAAQSQATPPRQVPLPGNSFVQIEGVLGDGVLTGTVYDGSGAVIPKAVVEITNAVTGQKAASAVTAEDGRYRVEQLEPGKYAAKVSSPGFVIFKDSLALRAHESTQLNVTLSIGECPGTIEVQQAASKRVSLFFFLSRPFRKNR
jgi:hypothetical protein